jgi:hypothetical protein
MENLRVLFFSCLYGSKKSSGRPSTSDESLSSTLRNPSRSDSLEEKRLREKEKTSEKLRGKDADSQTLKEIILNDTEKKCRWSRLAESQSRGPSTFNLFKPGKSIIDQISSVKYYLTVSGLDSTLSSLIQPLYSVVLTCQAPTISCQASVRLGQALLIPWQILPTSSHWQLM